MRTKILRFALWGMLSLLFITVLVPSLAYANSAAPPAIVIVVENPPDDLSIEQEGDWREQGMHIQRAWEGYWAFYDLSIKGAGEHSYTFRVRYAEKDFTCQLTLDAEYYSEYDNRLRYEQCYKLDLQTQKLEPVNDLWRFVRSITWRLLSTLLIEGAIFWLFGFRQARSWITFLAVNIVTQGTLAFLLSGYGLISLYQGSTGLGMLLFFCEPIIFCIEMVVFPSIVRERARGFGAWYPLVYAFVANLVSLILGSWLLTLLPV
jgi:hypothetical protein